MSRDARFYLLLAAFAVALAVLAPVLLVLVIKWDAYVLSFV